MSRGVEPSYTISFWLRELLVPVDGSGSSMKALDLAVDFAMRYGSRLTVLYACSECSSADVVRKLVEDRVGGRAEYRFVVSRYSQSSSSAANEILKTIAEGSYDAVIMGARGTSINGDINVGSTAIAVAAHAPVTVILVR
ncbi:MAG: universal stress protein [Acidilobus sp.]|uniref:universal stress protein n=1 Tax=Acidilobus sp. 7A TaxID=1577685 RepID=UPI000764E59C|nr:universal stress protein [Acidilobus sp. 7A]AMD30659.1 universal stress protein UspA [Acidilobus sp. 7A]